jgi:lysozyme family protein
MSAAFQRAWTRTHRAEKGYVNNPNDPGGPTNHGVTEKVARAQGFKGDMRDLSIEKAEEIAKREYWDTLRLDDIAALSEPIAQEVFDTNINLWFGAAATFLQRSLNALNRMDAHYPGVVVDGKIGSGTVAALKAYLTGRGKDGELVLLRCLNSLQCSDYMRQVEANEKKEDFFFGWVLNRVVV